MAELIINLWYHDNCFQLGQVDSPVDFFLVHPQENSGPTKGALQVYLSVCEIHIFLLYSIYLFTCYMLEVVGTPEAVGRP